MFERHYVFFFFFTDCSPGTGFNTADNTCRDCPKGQYNDGNDPNPNSCKFCPPGRTTDDNPGQTSCDVISKYL